jgi:hypothetical protein
MVCIAVCVAVEYQRPTDSVSSLTICIVTNHTVFSRRSRGTTVLA